MSLQNNSALQTICHERWSISFINEKKIIFYSLYLWDQWGVRRDPDLSLSNPHPYKDLSAYSIAIDERAAVSGQPTKRSTQQHIPSVIVINNRNNFIYCDKNLNSSIIYKSHSTKNIYNILQQFMRANCIRIVNQATIFDQYKSLSSDNRSPISIPHMPKKQHSVFSSEYY